MTTNTINIFLLGCRAAGKTSFISGLSILSRVGYGGSFRLTPNDKRTTNMISDLRKIADRREWPPATSNLVPLDFDLEYSERPFRVSILDYPGEDLRDAMETMDLESKELIFDRINRADCLLIMMDPYQDLRTTLNSNLLVAGRRQDALATAVSYLVKYRTDKRRILPLVAFVISKAEIGRAHV